MHAGGANTKNIGGMTMPSKMMRIERNRNEVRLMAKNVSRKDASSLFDNHVCYVCIHYAYTSIGREINIWRSR